MSDISISTDGRDAPDTFRAKVAAGEAGGARTIWIANHLFQRDPTALAGLALAETARMGAALMAVSPLTVHPVQAAMAAATLDELYPGRVSLCLGVGAPADLASLGLAATKPLGLLREALKAVRGLLAGETVTLEGERISIMNRRLANGGRPIPLVLAASGPQMLELAGSVADGVLISAGTSVAFARWCLDLVRRGAAGREVRMHTLVYASVDDSERAAHDRLRRTLAILLRGAHHRQNLDLAGSVLDQGALAAAMAREDFAAAEALITDDIVSRHAASGRPGQVREKLAGYHAAGFDEIVLAGVKDPAQIAQLMMASGKETVR